MVADVIKFPVKNKAPILSEEEIQKIKLQEIEECIDNNIKSFMLDIIESISDVNEELLENIDTPSQQMIGLLREAMRATINKFQGIHHDLQDIAEEIICFDEDVREQIIEGD